MTALSSPARPLSVAAVRAMNYNELIGVVRETNRPPGGSSSILEVISAANLSSRSRVLDIGTSTGVTAAEIGLHTGAEVVGIDINQTSLAEARERAARLGLTSVTFQYADATALPFDDASFDLVFCGNVTSLIDDKRAALAEYRRVLKPHGMIAAIPMYYLHRPSDALVDAVREAIRVNIQVLERDEAIAQFDGLGMDLVYRSHWAFDDISKDAVGAFCERILDRPHLRDLDADVRAEIAARYRSFMLLFRDNLALMGYSVLLFRNARVADDPELFTGRRLTP
jgi:SAM-dependent methyltransferase